MVWGLFLGLDIETYIPLTCGHLWTFFGHIWGAQLDPFPKKQHKKTVFWLFQTISLKRLGLMIWLRAYFRLSHWTIHSPYFWSFVDLLRSIWAVPKWLPLPKKSSIKKPDFCLFQTISPKRLGLMIWLGAYF